MSIISQKIGETQHFKLIDQYAKIGLAAKCSNQDRKTICNIESSYENGSIRKGYPFFLYTHDSNVGLINLSDVKKIYGDSNRALVFSTTKYTLLSSESNNIEGKVDLDGVDSNSDYLLFTTSASDNQIYFSREVPSWISTIVGNMATKLKVLYEQLAPILKSDVFTYVHYSGQLNESSWWGDVDSHGNISLRFYGRAWNSYDRSAELTIIKFMAHEYFHRYYQYSGANEWMMEGAAEAFSTALLYKAKYLNDSDFKEILIDKATKCRISVQKGDGNYNKYVNQDFAYSCGFFAFFSYPNLSAEKRKAFGASIDPISPLHVLTIIEANSADLISSSHWTIPNEKENINVLKRFFDLKTDIAVLDSFFSMIQLDLQDK